MKVTRNLINCLLLIVLVSSCTYNIRGMRLTPEYDGVDPKIQPFVNKYKQLAYEHGIVFHKQITIGFKDINNGPIIGDCNYSYFFREIDIDRSYWSQATLTSKTALIFHELSHGYCGRDHDYDDGKSYETNKDYTTVDGLYPDGCPKSILYPEVLSDQCMETHYQELIDELFNRCRPY